MSGPRSTGSHALVPAADWMPVGIDELEPAAEEALRYGTSSLVLAGPGAGKTEFLAQRAAYLLQTGTCSAPQRILAISYKRSAAANLADRVRGRAPEHAERFVSLTFDAFTKGLVDRFRATLPSPWELRGPYALTFWHGREVEDFISDLAGRTDARVRGALMSMKATTFLPAVLGPVALPDSEWERARTVEEYAVQSWWQQHYRTADPQNIDFVMINRLAELIVRSRPQISRALRLTYPFVFVDEFQDTTPAQLSILHSLFGHGTVVTAVGDPKQRIMKWAGAHQTAAEEFIVDFKGKRFYLTWNFRSSDPLVELQYIVATKLDPATQRSVSKATTEDGHTPACLWTYDAHRTEAQHLAQWMADDIARSDRTPSDFSLVARQRIKDYEAELRSALERYGIPLRNDDTRYGKLALQDLLKHEVSKLVIGVLTLAGNPRGQGAAYLDVARTVGRIHGFTNDEDAERRLGDSVAQFVHDLGTWLAQNPPASAAGSEVVARAVAVVDDALLRGYIASTHRGDDLDDVLESLTARLTDVQATGSRWRDVIRAIEASDAVTLATIHRSKGLEYHTVIFLGLDDDQWWAHNRDRSESTSTFFVGLSRAAQRLVFTTTAAGRRAGISDLYDALRRAGVPEQHWRARPTQ